MLSITQHFLPFLGSAIGTYMLMRMAWVERKFQTRPAVIIAGMLLEGVSIGLGIYTTITNPDTTKAIVGFTGLSIALGLLGPILVTRLEKAFERA